MGKNGQWGSKGEYKYETETGQLKTYTIGDEVESKEFGNLKKPVISAVPGSVGKDRFYVMALENVDDSNHYWYRDAWGKLNDIVAASANDFGKGKENTKYWLEKYGTIRGATEDSNDMWKIIQNKDITKKYPSDTGLYHQSQNGLHLEICCLKVKQKVDLALQQVRIINLD